MSNKTYNQNKALTSKKQRDYAFNTHSKFSKFQRDIRNYIHKDKEKEVKIPEKIKTSQLGIESDDDDDDDLQMCPEKPNENIPVPHKLDPIYKTRFSNEFKPNPNNNLDAETDDKLISWTEGRTRDRRPKSGQISVFLNDPTDGLISHSPKGEESKVQTDDFKCETPKKQDLYCEIDKKLEEIK